MSPDPLNSLGLTVEFNLRMEKSGNFIIWKVATLQGAVLPERMFRELSTNGITLTEKEV